MTPTEFRELVNECIHENAVNENLKSFLGGGIAGFITSWVFTHSAKAKSDKATSGDKATLTAAAAQYQQAVDGLKTALNQYAGSTPEDQYSNFVDSLKNMSFDHLKHPTKKPLKLK
jgi:hypothetical protein